MNISELEIIAKQIRRDIVDMNYKATSQTHPGPSLSCADIVTALYFNIMNIDPKNPKWEDRDRFIMSKGHAYLVWYAALARRGYFSPDILPTVRGINSKLQGHPDMKKTPGVDMTAGSLGNGLSLGAGMALYAKANKKNFKVYAIVGDAECQDGAIWEAALTSAAYKLNNLICIVDYNHYQSSGCVDNIIPMHPMEDKWRAFGWEVLTMNGHDMSDIVSTLEVARNSVGRPTVIIAHTIKGKGVSFMEHNNAWHSKILSEQEYKIAVKDIEEGIACR